MQLKGLSGLSSPSGPSSVISDHASLSLIRRGIEGEVVPVCIIFFLPICYTPANHMTNWKKLLKSLGFTDSEAEIYLASLEMGPASVQDIAKKAGVSRVTTYAVIESLSERGLMSTVEKGKKNLFVAESPERLVSFVNTRVKQMETTLKEVEGSLSDLKLIQKGEKPIVKLFEGPEALKAIQDDVLRSKPKEIDEFGNFDEITDIHPTEELTKFDDQLQRINPRVRCIYYSKKYEPKPSKNVEVKKLSPDTMEFKGDVIRYNNKLALSTFGGKKQISVLIESEELAKTFRVFFNELWKKTK